MSSRRWQMNLPQSSYGCSVVHFEFEDTLPKIRLLTSSDACPVRDLR